MRKAVLAFILTMAVASQAFSDEIDEVRELLSKEKGGDILYLSKINLGIPGGDTWIADRSNKWAYIYFIDNDGKVSVVKRGSRTFAEPSEIICIDPNTKSLVNLDFDIMRNIPGTRIGNKAATFGDFNGDGIDEIFDFYNSKDLCTITGYNSDKETMESYFGCRYTIKGPQGPSPVEFINNQGIYSIKVNLWDSFEKQYVWVLWAWNEEQRKFVEIEEFVETKKDNIKPSQPILAEQSKDEFAEDGEIQKEFADDNGNNSRFIFYIAIAVGVIALAIALFFAVRRKKG